MNYLIGFVIAVVSTSTAASDTLRASHMQLCKVIGENAEIIMRLRQAGTPMVDLMEMVGSNTQGQALVQAAYESPRYLAEDVQAIEISEFSNAAYRHCIKAIPVDAK